MDATRRLEWLDLILSSSASMEHKSAGPTCMQHTWVHSARGVGAVIVVGGAQTASQPPLGGGKGGGWLSAQQGTVASM
jgi:hypothetical protein